MQRIECKVYGGFYHAELIALGDSLAVVRINGASLTLKRVPASEYRYHDTCVFGHAYEARR